jgi:hypothetical protein
VHQPGLFFETWLPDGATLQLLFGKAAKKLMIQAGVGASDVAQLMTQPGSGGAAVTQLEGRSCHVEVDGHRVTFTRLAAAP